MLSVQHEKVVIKSASGDSLGADIFRPDVDNVNGAMLQVYSQDISDVVFRFAQRIAEQKYVVMLMQVGKSVSSGVDSSSLSAAVRYLQHVENVPPGKIALLGESKACLPVLQTAAEDTSVSAVILLSSPLIIGGVHMDREVTKLEKKPVVIIASQHDAIVPATDSQRLYDATPQPKKLVWLATDKHGSEVLKTDMEPIVKRVTLMLIDRYLKNR